VTLVLSPTLRLRRGQRTVSVRRECLDRILIYNARHLLAAPLQVVEAGDLLPGTVAARPRPTDARQLQLVEARLNEVLAELTPPGAVTMSGGAGDQVFISALGDDAAAELVLEHGGRYGPRGALAEVWDTGE
jgi:hypothetical protein